MYTPMNTTHLVVGRIPARATTTANLSRSKSTKTSKSQGSDSKSEDGKKPLLRKFWRGRNNSRPESIASEGSAPRDSAQPDNLKEEEIVTEKPAANDEEIDASRVDPATNSLQETLAEALEALEATLPPESQYAPDTSSVPASARTSLNPARSSFHPSLETVMNMFNDSRIAIFIDLLARDRPDLKREIKIMTALLNKDSYGLLQDEGQERSNEQVIADLLEERAKLKHFLGEKAKLAEASKQNEVETKALLHEQFSLVRDYHAQASDRKKHMAALDKALADMTQLAATFNKNDNSPAAAELLSCDPKKCFDLVDLLKQLKTSHQKFYERNFQADEVEEFEEPNPRVHRPLSTRAKTESKIEETESMFGTTCLGMKRSSLSSSRATSRSSGRPRRPIVPTLQRFDTTARSRRTPDIPTGQVNANRPATAENASSIGTDLNSGYARWLQAQERLSDDEFSVEGGTSAAGGPGNKRVSVAGSDDMSILWSDFKFPLPPTLKKTGSSEDAD